MSANDFPCQGKSLNLGVGVSIGNGRPWRFVSLVGLLDSQSAFPRRVSGRAAWLICMVFLHSHLPASISYTGEWVDILSDPNSRRVHNLSLVSCKPIMCPIQTSRDTCFPRTSGPILRKLRDICRLFELDLTLVTFTQRLWRTSAPCALTG